MFTRTPIIRSFRHFIILASAVISVSAGEGADRFRLDAERMLAWTRADNGLYPLLADFTDHNPRRISGSENLEKGLDWIITKMKAEGWNVRTQPVMVPRWRRGSESLTMVSPMGRTIPFCGLGGSIGTDGKPLKAAVLVVGSFTELKQRAVEAKGRIVVYNVPFTTYGETVAYRYNGASEAARFGAVASLVRSVGPFGIQTVHTGAMGYKDSLPKIPSGAITMEDALLLKRMQDRGEAIELQLTMEATWMPDAPSRNIIIEMRGSELPNEVVVMGGHIDSWDLGTGAMDDGGGCFVSWRALTMMKTLGLRPKRTIRVCFWTNEENGLRGGKAYADQTTNEKHVLGMESDGGVFAPTGFTCSDTGEIRKRVEDVATLLAPIHATTIRTDDGGADTGPLLARGVPTVELTVQGDRYFWFHHTEGDTIDKLSEREMNDCVYAMAVMAWCHANF
ncbi:MAG: M20/M25/M40 family metallo-hydrolase [Candidatus Kapabacteria bacterium]|nr:M20/M25/M40 family metallo-hydrolase [Candidatus Kapabacteria bacterium]